MLSGQLKGYMLLYRVIICVKTLNPTYKGLIGLSVFSTSRGVAQVFFVFQGNIFTTIIQYITVTFGGDIQCT